MNICHDARETADSRASWQYFTYYCPFCVTTQEFKPILLRRGKHGIRGIRHPADRQSKPKKQTDKADRRKDRSSDMTPES